MNKFYLKWKGVESGPFSAEDLSAMYQTGKIGLMHSVRSEDGDWMFLREFMQKGEFAFEVQSERHKKSTSYALHYIAYIFAGLSFWSPYVFICSAGVAGYAYVLGEKKLALNAGALSAGCAVLGLLFFNIIAPVLAK